MDKDSLLKSIGQINGVQGGMVVSKDGLVLANSLPDTIDPNLVSAVLSSMFTNIEAQSKRMQRGKVKRFSFETEQEVLSLTEVDVNGEKLLMFGQFGKDVAVEDINKALDGFLS